MTGQMPVTYLCVAVFDISKVRDDADQGVVGNR
jgi:hypothetical protein